MLKMKKIKFLAFVVAFSFITGCASFTEFANGVGKVALDRAQTISSALALRDGYIDLREQIILNADKFTPEEQAALEDERDQVENFYHQILSLSRGGTASEIVVRADDFLTTILIVRGSVDRAIGIIQPKMTELNPDGAMAAIGFISDYRRSRSNGCNLFESRGTCDHEFIEMKSILISLVFLTFIGSAYAGPLSKYSLSDDCVVDYSKYDRDCYDHWDEIEGQNTRQFILARDSIVPVTYDKRGRVIAGYWVDPYTMFSSDNPKDFDIEHGYALANADADGANKLSPLEKQKLANDPDHLYVTWKGSNRFKGAKSFIEYWPSDISFLGRYAEMRAVIANRYGLTPSKCERLFLQRFKGYSKYFKRGINLIKVRDWIVENREIFKHECFLK